MKKLLIILLAVSAIPIYGQLIHDRLGDIVPFSQSEKYKEIISVGEIHNMVLPTYDNDMLFKEANGGKAKHEVGSAFAAGFHIDTTINIRTHGKRIDIDEGSLWIFTIESNTSESLSPVIKAFKIPDGGYLSFITVDFRHKPRTFSNEMIQEYLQDNPDYCFEYYSAGIDGKRTIIEYFEPKEVVSDFPILLYQIEYFYAGKLIEKSMLKTGGHTTDPSLYCQTDILCDDASDWVDQAQSIGFIIIPFPISGGTGYSTGTVCFMNKEDDYNEDDKPYFLTCGHFFYPEINNFHYDIKDTYQVSKVEVYVDYYNPSCESEVVVKGVKIGTVTRKELGDGYKGNLTSSDDYSFWQTNNRLEDLFDYGIEYAGWESNHDFSDEGYAVLGHPKNDVMKILIENGEAYSPYLGQAGYFLIYPDTGVSQVGFSGSPIFNSDKEVVGWMTKGEANANCQTVGNKWVEGGFFKDVWLDIASYLTPTLNLQAMSADFPEFTPAAHCDNCVMDGDETSLNCGGSCYPCGMGDYYAV